MTELRDARQERMADVTAPRRRGAIRTGATLADGKTALILAAARAAFLETGYAAVSMDDVARRVRVSKATLYTRFPSKESLFAETVAMECRHYKLDVPIEELDGLPVENALLLIGMRLFDLLRSPEAVRIEQLVMGEAARFPEIAGLFMRDVLARLRGAVSRYIAHTVSRGLLIADDPVFVAGQFLSAVRNISYGDGGALDGFSPAGAEDRTILVARTVALFLDGVRPR